MRQAQKPWPPSGGYKFITEFLWFPTKATNMETGLVETRWLERATYLAEVVYWEQAFTHELRRWSLEPIEWIDTEQQRLEAEKAGYAPYYLLKHKAWETGDPGVADQLDREKYRTPPFLL